MKTRYILLLLVIVLGMPLNVQSAELKGKVVLEDGKPLAGVDITALGYAKPGFKQKILGKTSCQEDGAFSITIPDTVDISEEVALVAYTPGKYLGGIRRYRSAAFDRITAYPLTYVSGKVVNSGKPIPGLKVELCAISPTISLGDFDSQIDFDALSSVLNLTPITTDDKGAFTLTNIPSNMLPNIAAATPGVALRPLNKLIPGKPNEITALWDSRRKGTLVDEKGGKLPGITVTLLEPRGEVTSTTAEDGSFEYSSLETAMIIFGSLDEGLTTCVSLPVVPSKVILPTGVPFSGRVIDKDTKTPIPDAVITVTSEYDIHMSQSHMSRSRKTDQNGRFTMRAPIGQASVDLYSSKPEYIQCEWARSASFSIPKAGLADCIIEVKRNHIARGRVLDEGDKPVSGALVKIPGVNPVLTNDRGEFTIAVPPLEDDHRQSQSAMTGIEAIDVSRTLGDAKSVERQSLLEIGVTLCLRPMKSLKLIVKDQRNNPLPGAEVLFAIDTGKENLFTSRIFSDRSGTAVLHGLYYGSSVKIISANLDGYEKYSSHDEKLIVHANWADTRTIVLRKSTRTRSPG